MSIVSGTVGAVLSADAQGEATKQNAKNIKATNTANLIQGLMARGAILSAADVKRLGLPESMIGSGAAILPYYMGDIEKNLGLQAGEISKTLLASAGSPQEYQAILDRFSPAIAANERFAGDIASGAEGARMLGEAAPVFQSRTDLATSKKNAGLEALKETLNQIDAVQARKGYTGDTFGNRLLKFNARRNIATAGAEDIGGANLQNAIEKAGLQQQGRQMRLSSIALPDSLARSAVARRSMPGSAAAGDFATALQPFQFFNLGPHAFSPNQAPPSVPPNSSAWQLMAQTGAGVGNTALNYYLNRRNPSPNYNPTYTDTSGTYNPGAAPTSVDLPPEGGY